MLISSASSLVANQAEAGDLQFITDVSSSQLKLLFLAQGLRFLGMEMRSKLEMRKQSFFLQSSAVM